jgi:hypothetical protein
MSFTILPAALLYLLFLCFSTWQLVAIQTSQHKPTTKFKPAVLLGVTSTQDKCHSLQFHVNVCIYALVMETSAVIRGRITLSDRV